MHTVPRTITGPRKRSCPTRHSPTRRCPPSPPWEQSSHGTDSLILLSGEGARVPPLLPLYNAGADGFLLCSHPARSISRLCCRHIGSEAGLGHPLPLLPTEGTRVPVALILSGSVMGKGRLEGSREDRDDPALEDPSSRCANTIDSRRKELVVGWALSSRSGRVQCGRPLPPPTHTG